MQNMSGIALYSLLRPMQNPAALRAAFVMPGQLLCPYMRACMTLMPQSSSRSRCWGAARELAIRRGIPEASGTGHRLGSCSRGGRELIQGSSSQSCLLAGLQGVSLRTCGCWLAARVDACDASGLSSLPPTEACNSSVQKVRPAAVCRWSSSIYTPSQANICTHPHADATTLGFSALSGFREVHTWKCD